MPVCVLRWSAPTCRDDHDPASDCTLHRSKETQGSPHDAATRSVTELKGLFGKPAKPVSIDAMNATIAKLGAAARMCRDDRLGYQGSGALHHARRPGPVATCHAADGVVDGRDARLCAAAAGREKTMTFARGAAKGCGMVLVA